MLMHQVTGSVISRCL